MKILKSGFTLAETLVTLTIIGVIAAITLPALQTNIQKQTFASSASKAYNTISNAVTQYMAEQDVEDISDLDINVADFERYLKIKTRCAGGDNDCFAGTYRYLNGTNIGAVANDGLNSYILSDGIAIQFNNALTAVGGENGWNFIIDVNGSKLPNRAGYDLWHMRATREGVVDGALTSSADRRDGVATKAGKRPNCSAANANYTDCFAYLVRNDFQIDY